jgi:hypothetical protein
MESKPLTCKQVAVAVSVILVLIFAQPGEAIDLVSRARVSAVYDIEVVPPYAYALERGILRVLDVSDPIAVHEIAALELQQPMLRLTLNYPYLYLTGWLGQPLVIIDISIPTQPVKVASLAALAGIGPNGLEIEGKLAYITRPSESDSLSLDPKDNTTVLFEVLDLTDPAHPQAIGNVDLGIQVATRLVGGIARIGEHIMVLVSVNPRNHLFLIDARIPDKPSIKLTILLPEGKNFANLGVVDDNLFFLQRRPWTQQGLVVYRMHEKGEPELLGECYSPRLQIPIELIIHEDAVYATFKGEVDLVTFDVSNPNEPKIASTYTIDDLWAAGLGMTLVDDHLFVAGDGGPSPIFDVSDPKVPSLAGQWAFEGGWVGDVCRQDSLAILTQVGGGFLIYDVSETHAPKRLARYQAPSSVAPESWQWNVTPAVNGSLLFMAYETLPSELLDISNPTDPMVLGRFKPHGLVHAIALTPEYAVLGYREASSWWASTSAGGIEVVNVSNPGEPHAVALLDLGQAVTDIALHHDHLIAAHPGGMLTTLDISNPVEPVILSQPGDSAASEVSSMGRTTRIALSEKGNFAYVISRDIMDMESASGNPYYGHCTFTVIDLREVKNPRVLSRLDFKRSNIWDLSIVAHDDRVIIYTGDLLILNVSNPARPAVIARESFPPARYWVGDYVGLAADDENIYLGATEDGLWVYRLPWVDVQK